MMIVNQNITTKETRQKDILFEFQGKKKVIAVAKKIKWVNCPCAIRVNLDSVIQLFFRVIGIVKHESRIKVLDTGCDPLFRGYSPTKPVFIVYPPNVIRADVICQRTRYTDNV